MKYEKTLFDVSPPGDLYFAKDGMLVVLSLLPIPLKGLSKEDVTPRRWLTTAVEARTTEGN